MLINNVEADYPESPKNGSEKNGENPINEALVKSLSVAENGREW
jgi:hypothetical protein